MASQYRWAYEQAGEDELFGNVRDEIEGFLGSEGKWVEIKKDDGSSQGQQLHFDITDIFYKYMVISMEEQSEMPGEYMVNIMMCYHQFYMKEMKSYQHQHGLLYPNSTKTEEYFNYNIEGNI